MTGPSVRFEMFAKCPEYQEECLEHITSVPRKHYSLFVSDVMDRLGYSYDMIKRRQLMNQELDTIENMNETHGITTVVTTGGKGEGTSLMYENDVDRMNVINDVVCTDNPHQYIHQEGITLFQIENQDTSPGYTRLKLLKQEGVTCAEEIDKALFESEAGISYISSRVFIDSLNHARKQIDMKYGFNPEPISGPSTPATGKYHSHDQVSCFRCCCPDILEHWITRPRHHGWPTPATIINISLLDGHVVPVGSKVSKDIDKEWRICYSYAELFLMRSLNETQLKLYILLKKIAKTVLKPVCSDMTSYIIKNVVLWICEANGTARFKHELLLDRLFDCIIYLRTCIIRGNLPSYMISARNLLDSRINVQQRQELINLLNDLLKEGGRLLLRCSKIRTSMLLMYTRPDEYREHGERRDEIEKLIIKGRTRAAQVHESGMLLEDFIPNIAKNTEIMNILTHVKLMALIDKETFITDDVQRTDYQHVTHILS